MGRDLKVAYILHRFPYLTETFIMREMYWAREQGVDLTIFSLLPPKHDVVHEQAKELLPQTVYSSYLSKEVFSAQLYFLSRSPGRYLTALIRSIWQVYREPAVLIRVLLLFPKSVYFARRIEALKIDHIHAHFVWLEGIAAGIVKDLLDVTFSIHPHAFGLFARNQRDVRCELENATQVVTVSSYHRKYIADLCPEIRPDEIEIVHYGIDTDTFRPEVQKTDRCPTVILSVGRLHKKKGYEYLIDACAQLSERGVPYRCHIAGNGILKDELLARIARHGLEEQVILLGALEQKQILVLYQSSDIFALACVQASDGDQDGMPNVLIEAMACELPVVTTAVAGIPDLICDGENGLLVEECNSRALASALENLIVDKHLGRQLGRQARQTIMSEYQIQSNAARMVGIFRRVCQQRQMSGRRPAGPADPKSDLPNTVT